MRKLLTIAIIAPLFLAGCATTQTRVARDNGDDYQLASDVRSTENTRTSSHATSTNDHPEAKFGSR